MVSIPRRARRACRVLQALRLPTKVGHMGMLHYGESAEPIHIEDRALAHLKVVIATKLRRNESFTLSWRHPEGDPVGRSTIWLHPAIPIRFVFDDPETPELNMRWVEELMHTANSSGGIQLIEEVRETPEAISGARGD